MGLLTEGVGVGERRRKGDLKKAVVAVLDELSRGGGNVRWGELVRKVEEGGSVGVEGREFEEVVRGLEQEGLVQIVGEGARRSVRRVTGVV